MRFDKVKENNQLTSLKKSICDSNRSCLGDVADLQVVVPLRVHSLWLNANISKSWCRYIPIYKRCVTKVEKFDTNLGHQH